MGYFDGALRGKNLKHFVEQAATTLSKVEFDSIACRGNSGLIFASALAVKMEKNIIIVRKQLEHSHATETVEYFDLPKKIVVVDDFVCSGETLKAIWEEISKKFKNTKPDISGVYLYLRDYRENRYKFRFGRKCAPIFTKGDSGKFSLKEASTL